MGKILEISLPNEGVKEQIKEDARRLGVSASKYVLTAVEMARMPAPPSAGPELEAMRQEQRRLEAELKGKDLILLQQEEEIKRLRAQAFRPEVLKAQIDADLLKVLKEGPIHDRKLLDRVGAKDAETIHAVSRQLQILESSGFTTRTSAGWCWKG